MGVSIRFKPVAAAACAAAMVMSGAGVASAQGSLGEQGSSVIPVFDSPSTAAIESEGDGVYTATYTNRSGKDLSCFGFVLPEDVAADMYDQMRSTDFSEIGEGAEEYEPTEAEEAFDAALEGGHFGVMLGEDGFGFREYLRAVFIAQWDAEGQDYTEEEIEAYLDQLMGPEGPYGFFDEAFGGLDVVNFVDDDDTATWTATMRNALPEGESAGGIVVCFDGFDGDLTVAETTYVEIEHAEEGGAGQLPSSGIFGSAERIFSSAS